MTLETFFEKFDLFADAPNAVAKMRELVRHLAVRGKLVIQNLADEPAVELLKRILAEKNRRTGRSERSDEGQGSTPDDEAFEIPVNWEWIGATTPAVMVSDQGKKVQTKDILESGKYPVVDQGKMFIRGYCDDSDKVISVAKPIVLFGDHTRETKFIDFDFVVGADGVKLLQPLCIDPRFYFLVLRWLPLESRGYARHFKLLKAARIPLPPLAEQKRIVAKVDELMALCDRLEAQQQEREEQASKLARASLARFADAPTPANLHFLFHSSFSIHPSDLRKSILTLAVQGKLVPQDPNDEPAEELIERIAQMRHAKKAKEYEPVSPDEEPYDVPFSWSWVRLGNISLTSDSGWSPQCLPEARSGTDWGVLKVSAVSWGVFKPDENKALPPGMTSRPDCEVKAGDFLLSRANTEELVARSVVVDQTPPRLMMSDKIVRFTFPDEIEKAFINLANLSDPSREYYMRNASGTSSSMKNIGREVICNLPIALPPLAEQRRIVAKVEQLMSLVCALETQLAASRAAAANLLSALVAELTAAF